MLNLTLYVLVVTAGPQGIKYGFTDFLKYGPCCDNMKCVHRVKTHSSISDFLARRNVVSALRFSE